MQGNDRGLTGASTSSEESRNHDHVVASGMARANDRAAESLRLCQLMGLQWSIHDAMELRHMYPPGMYFTGMTKGMFRTAVSSGH